MSTEWDALPFITSGCSDQDACRHVGVNFGLFFLSTGADPAFRRAYQQAKLVRADVLKHRSVIDRLNHSRAARAQTLK